MQLSIENTFSQELPADPTTANTRRQVAKACFSYVTPRIPSTPSLLQVSKEMAETLGFSEDDVQSKAFLEMVTGANVEEGTSPYAMCYGGHQFGHWAGQLGDGRAINLAEITHHNKRWAIQLKGAGETPYSRTADGLAVLRSSIREHLCSEAMYHLGVPTTRSLSLALSGDQVLRDVLYDGNAAYEKGAIVCRVAPSFIRFGNFEIFASRQDTETLKTLVDYTIKHFYPHYEQGTKEGYLGFFNEVVQNTLNMIVHWQRVGFVHGVMNTDNMSILGLTIDYGPYGWLEGYDPGWTPNTTDRQNKRYRFGNQPQIGLWNLLQLANALVPLIGETTQLEAILQSYHTEYPKKYIAMMREKLGLQLALETDIQLIADLEKNLQASETDMTIFFRNLSQVSKDTTENLKDVFYAFAKAAFYTPEEITGAIYTNWETWFQHYLKRLSQERLTDAERAQQMNAVNPKYVLRNYISQLVIDEADKGNYDLLDEIHALLKNPYDEQPKHERWFAKRPEWARHKVGCSMLSCSS
ncbi:protein adenylyltransferase SelO [uncultured Dokdonia sp.]|uniref:protein adenylyltransferase SelO n=1 Tax=uncultured Dokdonia sp. TaxID=575653 RepID=UPI002613925A|nr:YdiU family protein [uncultured Dokdonia sp.]